MCSPNQEYVCPDCNGSKEIDGKPCKRCGATGAVTDIGFDAIAEPLPEHPVNS